MDFKYISWVNCLANGEVLECGRLVLGDHCLQVLSVAHHLSMQCISTCCNLWPLFHSIQHSCPRLRNVFHWGQTVNGHQLVRTTAMLFCISGILRLTEYFFFAEWHRAGVGSKCERRGKGRAYLGTNGDWSTVAHPAPAWTPMMRRLF